MQITIKKLEKSEVEITGMILVADFESYENKAIEALGERMEIPGFRKGKAPANMVKGALNEMMLLEEMAERAISASYPKILEEHKIDAIGRPAITITKIAKGNDLEFKIVTAVLPEMTLPDYKKIASDENKKEEYKTEIKIDEADVDKAVLEIRKMRAHQNMPKHEHIEGEEPEEIKDENLPEVNDEFVKTFGKFETVEDFNNKIRENLQKEKEVEIKDKRRLIIIESLIEKTKGEIPEILTQAEVDKMLYRLEADITNMGFKIEEYLKQIGKTEADMRAEWRADGEKRAKLQMIIHTISEKENLKASDEETEKEVANITAMYKDADPMRAKAYVEQMLNNEKVFAFLEAQ